MSEIIPAAAEPAPLAVVPVGASEPAVASDVASNTPAAGTPPAQAKPEAATTEGTVEPPRDEKGRFSKRTEQIQAQIGQLTAEKHSIRREIETMTRQREALAKQLATQPQIDPNDFAAQENHRVRSAFKQERLDETAQNVAHLEGRERELIVNTFDTKMRAAAETVPDMDKAVQTFLTLPVSKVAAELIIDSDQSAALVHHMANNPSEAYRINKLSPTQQAYEIAKLEARLTAPPVRRVSQAPAPVQTVSGGAGSNAQDLGSLSMPDYYATRMKQMGG